MPIGSYFRGSGNKVMANMQKEYGEKKGKSVFYATANKSGMKPAKSPANDAPSAGLVALGRPRLKRSLP